MASTVTVTGATGANNQLDAQSHDYRVVVSFTSAGASEEAVIDLDDPDGSGGIPIPRKGRIQVLTGSLDSGSGSTIAPVLGEASDPSNASAWRLAVSSGAALIHEQPTEPTKYHLPSGSWYLRPVPNSGSDNAATITLLISAGWE